MPNTLPESDVLFLPTGVLSTASEKESRTYYFVLSIYSDLNTEKLMYVNIINIL